MKPLQQLEIIWEEEVESDEKGGKTQSPEEFRTLQYVATRFKRKILPKILKKGTKEVEGKQIGFQNQKEELFKALKW